jgi:hypothetical protein
MEPKEAILIHYIQLKPHEKHEWGERSEMKELNEMNIHNRDGRISPEDATGYAGYE